MQTCNPRKKQRSKTADTKGLGRAKFLTLRSDFTCLSGWVKFDVLEPCGALENKRPHARVAQSSEQAELRWENIMTNPCFPSGRIKGKRLVIR
jgi:hypothetical protein